MKFLSPIFIVISLAFFLTACGGGSIMQNHDKRYLDAKSIPPTRIPPGVSAVSFRTEYPAPERVSSEQAKEVSLVPPGLYN
jgi:uncharacterized lipoprotein